eukprot:5416128-Pyramimonas_sp.AAC.1
MALVSSGQLAAVQQRPRTTIEPTAASALLQRGHRRREFIDKVHATILEKAAWLNSQTGDDKA